MNEENRQPPQNAEEKPNDGHLPVPKIHAAESCENGAKGADQRENPAALHNVSRLDRFKKWLFTVTVAELGMFLLTLVIAGSSIYYTRYAKRQWKVMSDQLPELKAQSKAAQDSAKAAQCAVAQARDQFQRDARPYIWITNAGIGTPEYHPTPKTNPPTGQITWTYHYTNYGKTPAYDLVSIDERIAVGVNQPFREEYGFAKVKKSPVPVPPNKDDFKTVVSPPGITVEEWNRLLTIDEAISIRVQVRYTDTYGGKYETGICLSRLANGAIKYCEGSYIK